MADFVIRVELHTPLPDGIYETLHAALFEKGLSNTIVSDDGSLYRLPSATYSYHGDYTVGAVRDWIQMIVEGVHKNYWVLVSEYKAQAWRLQKAV